MRNLQNSKRDFRLIAPMLALGLLLVACAPGDTAIGPRDGAAIEGITGPKAITIGILTEFPYIVKYGIGGTINPGPERYYTFHNNLTIWSETGEPLPRIAQKVPSLQDGDWKVNPDGTMEVTWKLRPDVFWHDGNLLTAEDYIFGLEIALDPRLTLPELTQLSHLKGIGGLRSPDPQTLVVTWKQSYIFANSNHQHGIPAISRRQVEPLYRSLELEAFEGSPVWNEELIGLGPYRVTKWEKGSFIEGAAFDKYFLGRPKIDRLTYRFIGDPNVQVANILAGTVDIGLVGTMLKPDQLTEIRNQWGPNKGQVFADSTIMRILQINFRLEGNPWDRQQMPYATDKRFRQGMLHAMDRDQLSEIYNRGYTTTSLFMTFPHDPVLALAERSNLPKYAYDPTRAQRLFAEAGWTKGQDGLLRNSAGQTVPFPCCRYSNVESENIRESLAWGADLKTAGLDVQHPIPQVPAGLSSTEQRRLQTLGWGGKIANYYFLEHYRVLSSGDIGREETRWAGQNSGGWSNAPYDALLDQRFQTLALDPRRQIELQLLRILAEEVPIFPIYMNPLGIVAREGITGFARPECTKQVQNCVSGQVLNDATTWNIHTWDIR